MLRPAQPGDTASRVYDAFIVVVAIGSIVPLMFRAQDVPAGIWPLLRALDLGTVYILGLDYLMRWITADFASGRSGWRAFARYPFTPMAVVDLLAILPTLGVLPDGFLFLRVLRVTKILRYSKSLAMLGNVFHNEKRTLLSVLGVALAYIFISGLAMFSNEPDTFDNFLDALYWATITLTTIGYGDVYPTSDLGKIIAMSSALFGMAIIAMPAGIITGGFLQQVRLMRDDREAYFGHRYYWRRPTAKRLARLAPARIARRIAADMQGHPRAMRLIAAMGACVAIDFLCFKAAQLLGAPVWLDTVGTALAASLLEPAAGLIVGFVDNLLLAIEYGNPGNMLYYVLSAIVALVYGTMLARGRARSPKRVASALGLIAILGAAIGWGLSLLLADGRLTTAAEQAYENALLSVGLPWEAALFLALLIDKAIDAVAVFALVTLIGRAVRDTPANPTRWYGPTDEGDRGADAERPDCADCEGAPRQRSHIARFSVQSAQSQAIGERAAAIRPASAPSSKGHPMRSVNIGIIGLGTVGGGVVRLIQKHHDDYLAHYGIDLRIVRACSRNAAEAKRLGIEPVFTDDWKDVVSDPAIDIVIELIGGEHPATEIFEESFKAGKHVVSANKALLGRHMEHLARMAAECGVQIKCEAAAAGGIPVVNALEHALVGNEQLTIAGIMNGTTNYILSRMADEGLGFDEVLAAAQAAGYAEADPTADVDGFDAASKIAILSSIGFRTRITTDDVAMQGIRDVSAADIAQARELGYVVKLLAIARNTPSGVDVRVHPAMIPATHQLASVSGAMNAVFVVGDAVGETMFYGAGAGSFPTASAVVGDVMALADHIAHGKDLMPESEPFGHNLPIRSIDDLVTRYYVRLTVEDKLGVLAAATQAFSDHGISIAHINQLRGEDGSCEIVYVTHEAQERNMNAAISALNALDGVRRVASLIRVEDVAAWADGALAN